MQTEGVTSRWSQNLQPVGDIELGKGEFVELYVTLQESVTAMSAATKIRFDILEEDYLLSGGLDDQIVSLVSNGATPPDSAFKTRACQSNYQEIPVGRPVSEFVREFRIDNDKDLENRILVAKQPQSSGNQYHIVGWWKAQYEDDVAGTPEFYFVVNVDDAWEDQTEDSLTVGREPAATYPVMPWYPQSALRRIDKLLSTGVFDWGVSKNEALEVLSILQTLYPEGLLLAVLALRTNGTWLQFRSRMIEMRNLALTDLERLINPLTGYLMPGDRVELVVSAGSSPIPEGAGFTRTRFMQLLKEHPDSAERVRDLAIIQPNEVRVDLVRFRSSDWSRFKSDYPKAGLGMIHTPIEFENDVFIRREWLPHDWWTKTLLVADVNALPLTQRGIFVRIAMDELDSRWPARFTWDEYARFEPVHEHAANGKPPISRDDGRAFIDPKRLTLADRTALASELHDIEMQSGGDDVTVERTGLHARQLPVAVPLVGMLPQDAVNAIARAYVDQQIYVHPFVQMRIVSRGKHYDKAGAISGDPGYSSTFVPDPNTPEAQRQRKFEELVFYVQPLRSNDGLTVCALLHYFDWIDKNRKAPEFLTREAPELWKWALGEASKLPPESPLQGWLAFVRIMQASAEKETGKERDRSQRTIRLFVEWLDQHADDPNLNDKDPADIWARFAVQIVRQDVKEEVERKLREDKERAEQIDWDAVGVKLDEAIELMKRTMWRAPEPEVVEGVIEEGGIGPFFVEKHGIGYLIMPSDSELLARNLVGRRYLHEFLERVHEPGFTKLDVKRDFVDWLHGKPEITNLLQTLNAQPYVEKYEFEVDMPGWATALEIGIGLIPIVGTIVGLVEAGYGVTMFGGHKMSGVERGITGVASLIPVAGKLFAKGTALVTARTIAVEYRLTAREAEVLYRGALGFREGTVGKTLLSKALQDINAGKHINDATEIKALEDVFKEAGLMDRATVEALLPAQRAATGAELLILADAEKIATDLVEDGGGVWKHLSGAEQDAVRAAMAKEPNLFRMAVRAETEQGALRYHKQLFENLWQSGLPKEQLDLLQEAGKKLSAGYRAARFPAFSAQLTGALSELKGFKDLRGAGKVMSKQLDSRIAALTAAGKTDSAAYYGKFKTRLDAWLAKSDTALQAEADALELAVRNNKNLLRNAGPGNPMLRDLWIRAQVQGKTDFARYFEALQKHFVGNFGEWETAWRMSDDWIILKAPDALVTTPGTDLVLISRRTSEILFIDNKALTREEADAVTALIRNFPKNLNNDVEAFAKFAGDPSLPKKIQEAFQTLDQARTDIAPVIAGVAKKDLGSTAVQQAIDAKLKMLNIRRVVTNAGGQVKGLSAELEAIGLDLIDLN